MVIRKRHAAEIVMTTLGQCSLAVKGQIIAGVPAMFYRIAAYLLASGKNHSAPRSKLGELFWPEADPQQAHSNLRQCLVRIRRLQESCGFQLIESNFSQVFLTPDAVTWDLPDFLEAALFEDDEAFFEMCRLYGGCLLANISESGDVFEDWLANQREHLRVKLLSRADACFNLDNLPVDEKRVECAMRMLEIGVVSEPAFRVLMQDAADKGNLTRLTDLYERCELNLHEELGVPVSRITRELYHSLASQLSHGGDSPETFMPPQMRPE